MGLDFNDLHRLRLQLGWSAAEMGRRLGHTTEVILKMESGEVSIDPDSVSQLQYLQSFVEQNALRLSQFPLAEDLMQRHHWSQIAHDVLLKHRDN